ncbi:hypothetical protein [Acidovorax sp.]|uniref:hypothetical protein n=1 Tax=Acidovorax sp. TaxID=1872122 RepID=UPI00260F5281|nr:hypothetical protein [Acidovorax sp.]
MNSPRRRRRRPSASLRLGCIALVLLLLAAAVLAWNTHEQLRGMRQESERVRAQLMADSLSQRIGHALDIGIPLDALVGVEALFNQRLGAHADIQSIALLQGPDKVLWSAEREQPARSANGTVADAPVMAHEALQGTVRLTLRETGAGPFARSAAILLLPTVLLLAALAFLAARFSEAQGVKLRNHAVRLATRAIASGHYDHSIVLPHRRGFDLRAQQLGHAVRGVHETLTRVRRLIASLRQTEPQAQRRERLDMLLANALGDHHFAEHGLRPVRVVAAEAQSFWISLMITMAAAAILGLMTALASTRVEWPPYRMALIPGSFLMAAALAAWVTQRQRWSVLSVLFSTSAGLVVLALALASGALDGYELQHMLVAAALWCGALAGAALTVCLMVEKAPRRQDFKHAMPRWPRAAMSAWVGATIWLGPALGAIAFSALGERYGVLALTLPALCIGFLLLRWNEPRSPWRHRIGIRHHDRPSVSATHKASGALAWVVASGIAAASGLLMVQGWMATTALPPSLGSATITCVLGVGVLSGLLAPLRRWRHKAAAIAVAAALQALALSLPEATVWQAPALWVATLLTAYLLGTAVTSTQRTLHISASVTLCGAAIGALLAAGLAAAGLSSTALGLVATLAIMTSWGLEPHPKPWEPGRKDDDAA